MSRQVVFATFTLALCVCVASSYQPAEWRVAGRADGDRSILVTFALKQRNLDALENNFWQISTPGSPSYGKHLTKDDITSLVAPSAEVVTKVKSWLVKKGVRSSDITLTGNNDFLDVFMNVKLAEKIFEVELHEFIHPRAGETFIRTHQNIPVEVPFELYDAVDIISGLSGLPPLRSKPSAKARTFASTGGTPVVTMIYASPTAVYPEFTVTCTTSSSTTNVVSPCADHPPAVQSFNIYVDGKQSIISPSDAQCVLSAGNVICTPMISGLTPYQQYSVSVSTTFTSSVESSQDNFYGVKILTSDFVTPQLAQRQYNVPYNLNGAIELNSQAVAAFGGQYFSPTDLDVYYQSLGIPPANITVVGPNKPSNPGDEAELDIQWIQAIGQGIPTTFWSIQRGGYLLDWAKEVNSAALPPLVHSISYADNEEATAQQYGKTYMDRVDTEFQKLGARGISICVSAGDAGVTNIGHGSMSCTPFQPQYPASSAYVTSVSATVLTPVAQPMCYQSFLGQPVECDVPMLEVAVAADNGMVWTTGGGFSNRTQVQSFQQTFVNNYLTEFQTSLPPTTNGLWNPAGRGYPDVSIIGHNAVVYQNKAITLADGTSVSSPTFAGLVAQLNAVRLRAGKPSLGYLNPFLYNAKNTNSAAFFDITVGDNKCGDMLHPPHVVCCPAGFQSTIGWDAVTGLGSPNFAILAEIAKQF